MNHIQYVKINLTIVADSDVAITPSSIGGFNSANELSTRNDDLKTASRPFDLNRDRFVMSEGQVLSL